MTGASTNGSGCTGRTIRCSVRYGNGPVIKVTEKKEPTEIPRHHDGRYDEDGSESLPKGKVIFFMPLKPENADILGNASCPQRFCDHVCTRHTCGKDKGKRNMLATESILPMKMSSCRSESNDEGMSTGYKKKRHLCSWFQNDGNGAKDLAPWPSSSDAHPCPTDKEPNREVSVETQAPRGYVGCQSQRYDDVAQRLLLEQWSISCVRSRPTPRP